MLGLYKNDGGLYIVNYCLCFQKRQINLMGSFLKLRVQAEKPFTIANFKSIQHLSNKKKKLNQNWIMHL